MRDGISLCFEWMYEYECKKWIGFKESPWRFFYRFFDVQVTFCQ